jgi:hypothetical protein
MQRRCFVLSSLATLMSAKAGADDTGAPIHYAADLSGDEETPTVESPGSGRAEFVLDRNSLVLSWTVSFKGTTSPVTGAHIHGPQGVGSNANAQIDLGAKGLQSPLKGSATLNESQLQALIMRRMYVNITTAKYKAGELRGQITRVPVP